MTAFRMISEAMNARFQDDCDVVIHTSARRYVGRLHLVSPYMVEIRESLNETDLIHRHFIKTEQIEAITLQRVPRPMNPVVDVEDDD